MVKDHLWKTLPISGHLGVEVKFKRSMPLKLKKKALLGYLQKQAEIYSHTPTLWISTIIKQKVMPTYSFAKL